MEAKLVVVGGDANAKEVKLKLPVIVGRGRDVTLTLPHPLVSRLHCEIFESNGHLVVRDLGSLNGTYVNNHRVTEAVLPPGELLTVGTVTFRAVYAAGEIPSEGADHPTDVRDRQTVIDPNEPILVNKDADTVKAPEHAPAASADTDELEDLEMAEEDEDRTTFAPPSSAMPSSRALSGTD